MREDLGAGYAEALRSTYREGPEGADYVMYWWNIGAFKTRKEGTKRFGFITTAGTEGDHLGNLDEVISEIQLRMENKSYCSAESMGELTVIWRSALP